MKITSLVFVSLLCSLSCLSESSDTIEFVLYLKNERHDKVLSSRLKEEVKWITPLNLSFCLPEILNALKTNSSFKKTIKDITKNYCSAFNDSLSYFHSLDQILFMSNTIEKNKQNFEDFNNEIFFLENQRFEAEKCNFVKSVSQLLKEYRSSDRKSSISNALFSSLIMNRIEFIKSIEGSRELTGYYRLWLNDIERFEFVEAESINYSKQIIERKRTFLVSKLDKDPNPLLKEFLFYVKKAKIRTID